MCFFNTSCQSGGCKDLDERSCSVLQDFTVFDQDHSLSFHHLCSEVDHEFSFTWKSYAFFESTPSNRNYNALILAEVAVGWIRGPIGPNGINIQLEKFQIEALSDWAEDSFTLALQVTNRRTGKSVTGDFAETFVASYGGGVAEEENFTLDDEGNFDWEQFIEPEEQKPSQRKVYKHSEEIQVISKDIPQLEDSQDLAIVLENSRNRSQVILEGPVLTDLKSRLEIENPEAQNLGFFQAINPFQKGGVWDFFRTGYRYRDCIFLRKKAKKEFDIRFSRN